MSGHETDQGLKDIVIGLVSPIGTDLDPVCRALENTFSRLGYSPNVLRLSQYLDEVQAEFSLDLSHSNEGQRYDKYMTAGTTLRRALQRGDALSMIAVGAIRALRRRSSGLKNAFILRSLKHPDEVTSLRNIYGPAFVLFSLASSRTARVQHLAQKLCKANQSFNSSEYLSEAERLINRDQQELNEKMGQKVSKVFHLADFFIDVDQGMEQAVKRLVELFLGNVFITPTLSEQGMFMAHAAAWRSASLQRQVGAVITTEDGTLISVGTNEAAKAGGGLYWEGDRPDFRDFQRGGEINDDMKDRMFMEVIQRIQRSGLSYEQTSEDSGHELAGEKDPRRVADWLIRNGHMENTRLLSVIEFGRCVHAEMAALMDAARQGISVNRSILFSTTFPCHECARHIVAAGIRKVFYIEPYPKSLVNELYPDSIRIEGEDCGDHVRFVTFVGVAPRRYQDMFRRGDLDRRRLLPFAQNWNSEVASPRLGEYPLRTQLINVATEESSVTQFARDLEKHSRGANST